MLPNALVMEQQAISFSLNHRYSGPGGTDDSGVAHWAGETSRGFCGCLLRVDEMHKKSPIDFKEMLTRAQSDQARSPSHARGRATETLPFPRSDPTDVKGTENPCAQSSTARAAAWRSVSEPGLLEPFICPSPSNLSAVGASSCPDHSALSSLGVALRSTRYDFVMIGDMRQGTPAITVSVKC